MAVTDTMKAWRIHEQGGPEKLLLEHMPIPRPSAGELLVRVAYASVSQIDWKKRANFRGVYKVQLPCVLGRDCSGTVVESTSGDFAAGDHVVAVAEASGDGTQSEFALVPATRSAKVPANVGLDEAIAFGVSGTSAWIAIMEMAQLRPGSRVLIQGGAGGIGSIAIQLAKRCGAHVIATCSTRNVAHVKSLGADQIIDYTREDFVAEAGACDLVVDTVGGEISIRSLGNVKQGGLLLHFVPLPPGSAVPAGITAMPPRVEVTSARLAAQLDLAARGVLKAQVGHVFAFDDARAAYALSETAHARGKVLLQTDHKA
jgi:NADPH:quinone reductase-like Zn-dependent oxidoreductase